jgi:transcriptional regulator with XRE-family HTH domain
MARISGKTADQALVALGSAIRSARSERMLSQEALADAAGIDRSHMGKIERGERNVTLLNVKRIAGALGMRLSDLFSRASL